MMGRRPIVIGVTGNIGAGKSTVGRMLGELGAEVIDADRVAHQAMRVGSPAFHELARAFGPDIVAPGGAIDRRRLAQLVFGDPGALARLEAIIHPATIAAINDRIAETCAAVVAVEAIKLIESGMAETCDSVWVVTSSHEQLVERAVARGMSREEVARRLRAQSPQREKASRADVIIDNSGSICSTRSQVREAWGQLAAAAACDD